MQPTQSGNVWRLHTKNPSEHSRSQDTDCRDLSSKGHIASQVGLAVGAELVLGSLKGPRALWDSQAAGSHRLTAGSRIAEDSRAPGASQVLAAVKSWPRSWSIRSMLISPV